MQQREREELEGSPTCPTRRGMGERMRTRASGVCDETVAVCRALTLCARVAPTGRALAVRRVVCRSGGGLAAPVGPHEPACRVAASGVGESVEMLCMCDGS